MEFQKKCFWDLLTFKDAEDAEYACKQIGIPFQTVDFVKEYWNEVFEKLVEEYQQGWTPNPDVDCNRSIKFGHFFQHCREQIGNLILCLSKGFWAGQAQTKVVKIKKFDFSYWASSTPWGHVLSLKTFCRNPALSWAIRYSVFQKVKFTSSLEFVCDNPLNFFL